MRIPFLSRGGVWIRRLAPSERAHRRAWADAISSLDRARTQTLKEDGAILVCRAHFLVPLGCDAVVKRWELRGLAAWLKSLMGQSRAFRHWRGAQWLEAHGIPTARCLALLTENRRGRRREYLVMEALDGPSLLAYLGSNFLQPREEHALARAIARQLVTLTLAGRYNRDHKPSNLIVFGAADHPEPTVAIIDTVAIRKLRPWRRADLYAMLASLVIEPTGCGCPPRRALMMRVLHEHQRELLRRIPNLLPDDPAVRRAARHMDWMRVVALVQAHGDPRPRVNPLGPAA